MTDLCPRRHCGMTLDIRTDGNGKVAVTCHSCARNKRGLCRDCPGRLDWGPRRGTAMRCQACSRKRDLVLALKRDRGRYPDRRAKVLKRAKAYRSIPTVRERRRKYMADFRAEQPRDAFDRAYGRTYMKIRRADPAYRDQQNKRRREIRAMKKQRTQECAA